MGSPSGGEAQGSRAAAPKVFGIGLMKTGTSSLGACLDGLGYKHRTYFPKLIRQIHRGELDEVWEVADHYDSFEDHPWPELYEQLDERYPDAKFILTERRDAETWFGSLAAHAKRMGPTAERYILFGHGWPLSDPEGHLDRYRSHSEGVRAHFAGREDKLLVVCWETGTTAKDVAEFLGHTWDAPDEQPPKLNTRAGSRTSPRFWFRNTIKYVLIGRLGLDPFRWRGRKSISA